jgi:hypothetical protein
VHRQSQNFIIPEFIFNFGKQGDYKITCNVYLVSHFIRAVLYHAHVYCPAHVACSRSTCRTLKKTRKKHHTKKPQSVFLNIFAAMSTAVNGKEVCVICADATHEVVVLNCCENHMCTGCVARAKTSRVASLKEIVVQWGSGRAHQCPKCGEGPVEHFACNYLGINAHNQCPVCAYISTTATDWPKWDGEIPQRLTDMAQAFLCLSHTVTRDSTSPQSWLLQVCGRRKRVLRARAVGPRFPDQGEAHVHPHRLDRVHWRCGGDRALRSLYVHGLRSL